MTPEEFTNSLRGCVRDNFPAYLDMAKEAITDDGRLNERKLQTFLASPGGTMAKTGLLRGAEVDQVNALVVAVYKSKTLHDYMTKATEKLKVDEVLLEKFKRLGHDPRQMPEPELKELLDKLLRDDTFVTGPIKVLMTDPSIRKALNLPADLTFEVYIQRVRKAIRDANSLDEVLKASHIGPGGVMVCNLAVACAIAIAAIVTIAAIVHTGAVAVNYVFAYAVLKTAVVFTVAGQDLTTDGAYPTMPVTEGNVYSNCINESNRTVWLAVRTPRGLNRIPLPPSRSSAGMGLSSVEALLIGGRFNPAHAVTGVRDDRRECGAYVLAQNLERPGEIVLREGVDGLLVISNHAQACAEAEGRAGWSDLAGGGPAGSNYDAAFSMSETAAAVPPGADLARMIDEALNDNHFYNSLRMASLAERLKTELHDGKDGGGRDGD